MQIREPNPQAASGLRVFDAERDDNLMALAGDRDLAADVFVLVAMLGEDQQHCPAGFNRLGDLVVKRLTRAHVARRDPARQATPLQLVDDFERGRPVFANMADEQEEIGHGPGAQLRPNTVATLPSFPSKNRASCFRSGSTATRSIASVEKQIQQTAIINILCFLGCRARVPKSIAVDTVLVVQP
jgi:hypothetical protein